MSRLRAVGTMCCAMILFPPGSAAQHTAIDKGTLLIGGSAGISGFHRDGDQSDRFSISLSPMVGVFVARGLAVWGTASFSYVSESPTSVNNWGLGPGAAYYLPKLFGLAYPFLQVESLFSWMSGHTQLLVESRDFHSSTIQLRPSAGLLFMLIQHVGIEGEFYLMRSWATRDLDAFEVDEHTTMYGFSAGVTAFVF